MKNIKVVIAVDENQKELFTNLYKSYKNSHHTNNNMIFVTREDLYKIKKDYAYLLTDEQAIKIIKREQMEKNENND